MAVNDSPVNAFLTKYSIKIRIMGDVILSVGNLAQQLNYKKQ